jgi:tetratricopeptide (TPR) repeat protein
MDEDQELGWLVRDTSNRIRGPFKTPEIVQMIKKGQLKGKTEVARANSYWFAIEEKVELGRFIPEFNGGKPPPEQPTQMTATLTEADIQDHGVDITTFTKVDRPPAKDGAKEVTAEGPAEGLQSSTGQIEWLSDEFAEEFGNDFGQTISVQTDVSALNPLPAEVPQAPRPMQPEHEQPTPKDNSLEDKKKKEEMLKRATVKADTLPSEHKGFQGERPKPIDALIRSPMKQSAAHAAKDAQHATVSVPVEDGPAPKMFIEEDEAKVRERRSKRNLVIYAFVLVLAVAGGAVYFLNAKPKIGKNHPVEPTHASRGADAAATAARLGVLTLDLETTKNALADLESDPMARGEATTYLIKAVMNREILGNTEDAMVSLDTARQQARNKNTEAEVYNLMALYNFDHEPAASIDFLKKNADGYKNDLVFRYNLALGYLRTSHPVEAIGQLDALLGAAAGDPALFEDGEVALGWALDSHCAPGTRDSICSKRASEAEDAYTRAIETNEASAKGLLGRALFRMRRQGVKASEADFRAFIDLAPELDPPTRVLNIRKMGNHDFYTFAHSQIVEINNQNMGKPSAVVMAADAVISCILGRIDEAKPILDTALSNTGGAGDVNLAKASGYRHWKSGELDAVADALSTAKERDRASFAINLMLGKVSAKLRKKDAASGYFHQLMTVFPNRSDGYSLSGDLMADQPAGADEAKADFQQALAKDPLDLVALRGLMKLNSPPALTGELKKNLPF